MKTLTDMLEQTIHDRSGDCGFSAAGEEVPFRGAGLSLDYRQPGFAFTEVKDGEVEAKWRSFVQGVECPIPSKISVGDGVHLAVVCVVKWEFASQEIKQPVPNNGLPWEPRTYQYATGAYSIQSVELVVNKTLPLRKLVAFKDFYFKKTGLSSSGHPFTDEETIVCDLGVFNDDVFVRAIAEGNLFLSRAAYTDTTFLTLNP